MTGGIFFILLLITYIAFGCKLLTSINNGDYTNKNEGSQLAKLARNAPDELVYTIVICVFFWPLAMIVLENDKNATNR